MSGNVPPKPTLDQIVWFETHLPSWAATPAVFGASVVSITALTALVLASRKSYNDAQSAREASKSATKAETVSANNMLFSGRAVVNTMKAFIEQSHNDLLWAQSGLSPDSPPGVAPTPTAPTSMTASLDQDGFIQLHWKASQPVGVSRVVYSVRRSIDAAPYVLLNTVGKKTYTDMSVPVGTRMVQYTIMASHGDQQSPWSSAFTIRFGIQGGGMMIVSTETAPMKMAA